MTKEKKKETKLVLEEMEKTWRSSSMKSKSVFCFKIQAKIHLILFA